jgi:hypothetical protein
MAEERVTITAYQDGPYLAGPSRCSTKKGDRSPCKGGLSPSAAAGSRACALCATVLIARSDFARGVRRRTKRIPSRLLSSPSWRLGYGTEATHFYDEHVEADAVHESIAAWDLAGGLARVEPHLVDDILFGARALLALEARWAQHLLDAWRDGRRSLLRSVTSSSPSG